MKMKVIKLVRVDSRLLHATVALNWNRFVNSNVVIVVTEKHIRDPFMEKIMQLSFPTNNQLAFYSVEQLIDYLKDDETIENLNIMIIFDNLSTLYKAVELGFIPKEVQLPYPGRIILKKIMEYFDDKELTIIRSLQTLNIKFYFQTSPMDGKNYQAFK